jgi:hypothetical protein
VAAVPILVGALSGALRFSRPCASSWPAGARQLPLGPGLTAEPQRRELTNHDFLEALRHLAFTRQGKVLRPVDYKNLGAEELGGVYESLLA